VKPLLKKPSMDPFDMKSYCPVSNLTFIGKFLERFAVSMNMLARTVCFRFTSRHSIETDVVDVLNEIFRAVDSGKVCAVVLLDLSPTFDTVNHSILLTVLK